MTTPFFQNHVFVCTNRRAEGHEKGSCAQKGSEQLRNYMKEKAGALKIPKTRINTAGCLDRCEYGPVFVIYPQGTWYSVKTREDVDEILQTHLIEGRIVERLLIRG
jgi:(2Fe-2S) ferredoxin